MAAVKAPNRLLIAETTRFCPGCGHGIANRLLVEVLEEMGLINKAIITVDVACGCMQWKTWNVDTIMSAHGRDVAVAVGVKSVRPFNPSIVYVGDGAAYSIGLAETMHAALRNNNVTVVVVNNGVYGMTGGQMSPTTMEGQKTTSSPSGRNAKKTGKPFDIVDVMGKLNIAYLARGSMHNANEIRNCKKYLGKAIEKQMNNAGFSLVELLAPCPTNWNMSPVNSMKRIKEELCSYYDIGEFIDGGRQIV